MSRLDDPSILFNFSTWQKLALQSIHPLPGGSEIASLARACWNRQIKPPRPLFSLRGVKPDLPVPL